MLVRENKQLTIKITEKPLKKGWADYWNIELWRLRLTFDKTIIIYQKDELFSNDLLLLYYIFLFILIPPFSLRFASFVSATLTAFATPSYSIDYESVPYFTSVLTYLSSYVTLSSWSNDGNFRDPHLRSEFWQNPCPNAKIQHEFLSFTISVK